VTLRAVLDDDKGLAAAAGVGAAGVLARLQRDMATRRYTDLSRGPNGGRAAYVADILNNYRDAAEAKLLEEDPTLRRDLAERLGEKLIGRLPEARQPPNLVTISLTPVRR
jgi:hypothetical protein